MFGNDPRGCRVRVSFSQFQWVFLLLLLRDRGVVFAVTYSSSFGGIFLFPPNLAFLWGLWWGCQDIFLLRFGLTQRGRLSSLRGLSYLFESLLGLGLALGSPLEVLSSVFDGRRLVYIMDTIFHRGLVRIGYVLI